MSFNKFEKEVAARNATPLRKEVIGDKDGDVTIARVKKIYELIVVDPVWDNWDHVGFVEDLKDASALLEDYVVGAIERAIENGVDIIYDGNIGKKKGHKLEVDEVERAVKMPNDFIQEYASTFCMCIDRPYISLEELVEDCLPGYTLEYGDDAHYGEEPEETLCIRGFIHEWPVGVVDRLMAWENAVGAFEKMKD